MAVLGSLIVLSCAASTVLGIATAPQPAGFRRQQPGWPPQVANSVHNASWPQFATESQRWDAYEAPTFDLVFLPESEEALSTGLHYLTSNRIPFLAKSGGHGYSTTLHVIQNAVMINMVNFNYSRVNADKTATIGSGATFEDMVRAIGAAGRELTVGSCPCVGATGAMLGGGVGRLQGVRGLTSDAVRKVRLALWNGTIVEASDHVNQDLFWGVRGAGQNFGVVIETTFETYPSPNGGLNYEADFTFSLDAVPALIDTVNSLIPLAAPLSLIVICTIDPKTLKPVPALNLGYAGTQEEGRKFSRKFANFSLTSTEAIISWADLPTKGAGGAAVVKCAKGQRHIMYGVATKRLDTASFVQLFHDFGSFVQANPAANESTFLVETFAQQGVEALPLDYDAFPHRGKLNNLVEFEIAFDDDSVSQVGHAFGQKWRDHFAQPNISGYDTVHVYQNYGHGDEPPSVLYGREQWRHKRLTALKNKYDPHGVFNAYHAIPSSLAGWT